MRASRANEDQGPEGRGNTARDRQGPRGAAAGHAGVSTAWAPLAHQDRYLAAATAPGGGIVVAVGGIGSGKSEPGALALLTCALANPLRVDGRPTRWFAIAPRFSLIRDELFPKILEHARRLQGIGYGEVIQRVTLGQDPKIVLLHGQTIFGRSADDPNKLRGYEIEGFWQDEAQNQAANVFRIAVSRMRSAQVVRAFVTASPEDSPGWIQRMIWGKDAKWNEVRSRTPLTVERWDSRANTTNTAEVLEIAGAVMDAEAEGVQVQEVGGRFPGTEEAPSASSLAFERAFVGDLVLSPEEVRPGALGVDIGETWDYTTFVVISRTGVVLFMRRFKKGDPGVPRENYYSWLEGEIVATARRWRVPRVVIDLAKSGKPVCEAVAQTLGAAMVEGYPTDAVGKKSQAVEALLAAVGRAHVRAPASWRVEGGTATPVGSLEWLRVEFRDLQVTDYGHGKRQFTHPKGGHDDLIVGLALALHGLGSRRAPSAMPVFR